MKEVQGVIEASLKRDTHLLRVAVFNLHKEVKKEGEIQYVDSEEGTPTVD